MQYVIRFSINEDTLHTLVTYKVQHQRFSYTCKTSVFDHYCLKYANSLCALKQYIYIKSLHAQGKVRTVAPPIVAEPRQ